jgi:hypothetical protein
MDNILTTDHITICNSINPRSPTYTFGQIREANKKLIKFLKLGNPRLFGFVLEVTSKDKSRIISCDYATSMGEAMEFFEEDISKLKLRAKRHSALEGNGSLSYTILLPVQDITDILRKPKFLYEEIFRYLSGLDSHKFYRILHRLGLNPHEGENPLTLNTKFRTCIRKANYIKLVEEIICHDEKV